MGKSNRIRTHRATERVKSIGVKNKSKGMPSWALTLITVVLSVALLLSVAGILLSANGVFTRFNNVATSDNYKVNANMMAYFYNTQYQNFYSNYSTYISSGYFSIDPSKDLTKQPFGGPTDGSKTYYDELFLGEFEGTWHDYFMSLAVDSAETILMYCEAAAAYNITLTDEDKATIDESIESYRTTATASGYPNLSSFFSAYFGKGVSEGDVRDCMELSLLASKTMEKISDEIEASVTKTDIDTKYDANKLDYNVIDYTYYSFNVNYDEVAKELLGDKYEDELKKEENKTKVLAEYKTRIEKAKAAAAELKAITELSAFQSYIYNYVAKENIDDLYGAQTIKTEIKPTDDVVAHIKAELVKAVVAEIVEGKEATTDVVEIKDDTPAEVDVFGKTVKKDYAKIINTVKSKLFSTVLSAKNSANVEKANYIKDNTFSTWAFDAARKDNELTLIAEYDGSAEGEIKNEKGKSQTAVYFLTKTQRKDAETSKNVSYMIFEKEADAKAAITDLVTNKAFTKDAFLKETAATKKAASSSSIEDYTEGGIGITDFDKWVFDAARKAGDITAEPVKYTSGSTSYYFVILFEGEGQELWYLDVKSTIMNERAEAKVTELEGKHKITVKEDALKYVNVTA